MLAVDRKVWLVVVLHSQLRYAHIAHAQSFSPSEVQDSDDNRRNTAYTSPPCARCTLYRRSCLSRVIGRYGIFVAMPRCVYDLPFPWRELPLGSSNACSAAGQARYRIALGTGQQRNGNYLCAS